MAKRLVATRLQWKHIGPWSLSVEAGHCLGISGASGVGKSTLLRILANLVEHDGEASIDGIACSTMSAPDWRRRVRYCASNSGWWSERVADHFAEPNHAKALGEAIGLPPTLFDQNPTRLSTGERQRLALLRSLENHPEFLLLDEPTSALDPTTTIAVEALIAAQMQAGLGVILVSHDAIQLQRLATATLEMSR